MTFVTWCVILLETAIRRSHEMSIVVDHIHPFITSVYPSTVRSNAVMQARAHQLSQSMFKVTYITFFHHSDAQFKL